MILLSDLGSVSSIEECKWFKKICKTVKSVAKDVVETVVDAIVKFDQLDNNIYRIMQKHLDTDISDSKLLEIGESLVDNDTPRVIDYVSSLNLKLIDEELFEETKKDQETGFVEENNEQVIDNTLYIYYNKELIASHIITTNKLNYKADDMVNILKTDAFKNKDDEYIESFVKKQLKTI